MKKGRHYERRGYTIVLIGENGKRIDRLTSLPSCEDPAMKKLIEDIGISHFVIGDRWLVYDSKHMALEEVKAPYFEGGIQKGFHSEQMITQESVESAKELWEKVWNDMKTGKVKLRKKY